MQSAFTFTFSDAAESEEGIPVIRREKEERKKREREKERKKERKKEREREKERERKRGLESLRCSCYSASGGEV